MMINKFPTICFLIFCFVMSCRSKNEKFIKNRSQINLFGYWIPQQINWGGDDANSKDTGDLFRIAHFRTLCFDTLGNFIYLASTQRKPQDYNDSIIFAGEPIINVFGGTWKFFNDTILMINFKPIEHEINPPDNTEKQGRIQILFEKDTLLLFENKFYHRTYKYDKISQQMFEEYKNRYLK